MESSLAVGFQHKSKSPRLEGYGEMELCIYYMNVFLFLAMRVARKERIILCVCEIVVQYLGLSNIMSLC